MKFLAQGWKDTIAGIRQHLGLVLIILLLQIVLVAAVAVVGVTYQVKILENAKNIIEPLQNANFNADSLQQGQPFLNDFQSVYVNYQSLIKNLIALGGWLTGIFLIINGWLWGLSHRLLGGKGFLTIWAKYIVASIVLLGPFLGVTYYVLRGLLNLESDPLSAISPGKILAYLGLAAYYFLLVAFASIGAPTWKQFIKSFFRAGITRIYKTIVVLLINLVLLGGNLYLIYYAMNNLPFAMVVTLSLLFFVVIVLTRLLSRIYKPIVVLLINLVLLGQYLYLIYYAMNILPFAMVVTLSLLFFVVIVLTRLFWIACLQKISS